MGVTLRGVGAVRAQIALRHREILLGLVEELRAATPVDTGRAAAGWALEANRIVNPVEYIGDLNSGSSQQAPSHFIEQTVLANPDVKIKGLVVTQR